MYVNDELERPDAARSQPLLATGQLQLLLDQVEDIIFQIDEVGRWVFLNQAWLRVTGYQPTDTIGQLYDAFFDPADHEQVRQVLLQAHPGEQRCDLPLLASDGTRCWVAGYTRSLYDATGSFSGSTGRLCETHEQHTAQEDIRRPDAILTAVSLAAEQFLQNDTWSQAITPVLTALGVATEVSRVYLYANSATHDGSLRMTKRAEWAASGIPNLLGDPALQDLRYHEAGFGHWVDLLGQGEVIYGNVRDFPPQARAFLQPYGIYTQLVVPIFVGDHWWGFIGFDDCRAPREWSAAEQDALRAAARMMGEAIYREQITSDLRFSQSRLQGLLDASPIVIWCKNLEGRYELWCGQSQFAFGLTNDQVIGRSDEEIFGPEMAAAHVRTDMQVMQTGQPIVFESPSRRSGHEQIYEVTKFPLLDAQGQPYAIYGIGIDISRRKRAEQNQRLLAQVSAQFNTSLEYETTLRNIAQLIASDFADWCTVVIISGSSVPDRLALACASPEDELLRAQFEAYIRSPQQRRLSLMAIQSKQPIFIPEVDPATVRSYASSEQHLELLLAVAPRSLITVPLAIRDEIFGTITFTRSRNPQPYSSDDLALANELAGRAALAVDNAHLYRTAQRRLAELTTVQHVARTISSAIQLDLIFRTVVEQIRDAFGYQMVSIYLREGDQLLLQAYVGYDTVMDTIHITQGASGRVCRTGQAIFVRNAADDPDFIVVREGTTQAIIMPLHMGEAQTGGTLMVESSGDPPLTNEDFALLQLLADQVSVAVVNARLYQAAQQALRDRNESLAVLNALFASAPLGLALFDADLRLSRLNAALAQMINHPLSSVVGLKLHSLVPRLADELEPVLSKVLATGIPLVNYELVRLGDAPEPPRTFLLTAYPVRPDEGQAVGVGIAVTEITDRKRAEEDRLALERKLLETQKLESLGVMAGGIAHDFNNLLMTILGNTHMAMIELPAEHAAHASLGQVEIATRHAADLTAQMLAYAGKGRFVNELVDLNELVIEMAQLLQASLPKSATLLYELAPGPLLMTVDTSQIRQVVLNLVSNAAEAIGEQRGTITLKTNLQPITPELLARFQFAPNQPITAAIALTVRDSGAGMDPETLTRIFDPFYTTKFAGRGLGLPAVQGIVRSHNGTLLIESALGQGTAVTALLPYEPQARQSQPQPQARPAESAAHGTLLVIDDEEGVRMVTSRLIKRLGYQVVAVADGEQGLALLHAQPTQFSCVLLDLTMPHMSGEAVLTRLRQLYPNLPVVVMSGYSTEEVAEQLAALQPDALLHKPFSLAALGEQIRQALERPPAPQFR
jgi:PAS domain S-box-containing protein